MKSCEFQITWLQDGEDFIGLYPYKTVWWTSVLENSLDL